MRQLRAIGEKIQNGDQKEKYSFEFSAYYYFFFIARLQEQHVQLNVKQLAKTFLQHSENKELLKSYCKVIISHKYTEDSSIQRVIVQVLDLQLQLSSV